MGNSYVAGTHTVTSTIYANNGIVLDTSKNLQMKYNGTIYNII